MAACVKHSEHDPLPPEGRIRATGGKMRGGGDYGAATKNRSGLLPS